MEQEELSALNDPKQLLVLLPNPMGDVILSGPALRWLRSHFPDRRISFMGNETACDILADNPWADELISYGAADTARQGILRLTHYLRSLHVDGVVVLPNSFRSALSAFLAGIPTRIGYARDGRSPLLTHTINPFRLNKQPAPLSMIQYYSRLMEFAIGIFDKEKNVSFHDAPKHLELFSNPENLRQLQLMGCWDLYGERRPVMLVPGGSFGPSKWWPAERYAKLADHLIEHENCFVVLCCAPNPVEEKLAAEIIASAKNKMYSLADDRVGLGILKELIRHCRLVISNDTGPCHIAAAFGVPLITLFGPTDPRWTATDYEKEIRLRVDLPCGPCQQKQCDDPENHRCLTAISLEHVIQAAKHQLAHPSHLNKTEISQLAGHYFHVYDENVVPLRDGMGLVHELYRPVLEQARLGTLDDVFKFGGGQRLDKPGLGSRERLQFRLKIADDRHVTVYLKRYNHQCKETAVNDFAGATALAQRHISVPRPIAYGQTFGRLTDKRSFVIFEELPNADALERLMPRWKQIRHEYDMLRDRKELVRQLARLIRRLHNAGYVHRDLYLSHIFLCKDADGKEKLCLIDLQRVFQPKVFRQRWRVKDLAQLWYSSRDHFSTVETVRFLRHYLNVKRLDDSARRLIKTVQRKTKQIARHDLKKRQKIERNGI